MVSVRYLGGPTALLGLGGLRLLTDPTFDPPGEYPIGNRSLVKTTGPALDPEAVGPVDVVLLSHDQHPDNLDRLGREYVLRAPLVLSTASAQRRVGGPVQALPTWDRVTVPRPDGGTLDILGVPAQHGPDGTEHLVGEVTGFVLSGEGLPTVYVSGDNASLEVVRAIAERVDGVDVALLFAGAARTPLVPDGPLTLTSALAAEAARVLRADRVVPLHYEHWAHFTEGPDTLVDAFERAGLSERLTLLPPGATLPRRS
jgi:L-ascorbate metabolism protein UlaG (beta-lactamase superfamily)